MSENYTVTQAANILNVHPDTVRRWIRTNKMKCIGMEGGWKRIPEEEISKYLDKNEDPIHFNNDS